jgi:hypothetical protein
VIFLSAALAGDVSAKTATSMAKGMIRWRLNISSPRPVRRSKASRSCHNTHERAMNWKRLVKRPQKPADDCAGRGVQKPADDTRPPVDRIKRLVPFVRW